MRHHAFVRLFSGILIIFLAALALGQQPEQPPALVKLAEVREREMSENKSFIGVLYFDVESAISSEVDGLIQKVHFREGDAIKAGEVLAEINTDFLDKDIAIQEASIEQVTARIQNTQKNLERYRKLLKSDAASKIDYDNLYYTVQELVKERESLKASLAKTKLMREKCQIKAPYDGIILARDIGEGDWVDPGRMLFRLGSANDLFANVSLSENLLRFIEKGESVDLEINAYGEKLTGLIDGILPVADAQTKNVSLKVRIGNLEKIGVPVAENMSITAYVPISEKKKLKMIPRDALVKHQGGNFVYTVKENKAAILPVNIVAYVGEEIGVNDAHIEPGMKVVVDGNERLRPDQPVQIAGQDAPPSGQTS